VINKGIAIALEVRQHPTKKPQTDVKKPMDKAAPLKPGVYRPIKNAAKTSPFGHVCALKLALA
jgi:hypothetical protein